MTTQPTYTDLTKTHDFAEAYRIAKDVPDVFVNFEGTLPSGYEATQKIMQVSPGKNALTLAEKFAADFGDARVTTSSCIERGTHIVVTFGELKVPAPAVA